MISPDIRQFGVLVRLIEKQCFALLLDNLCLINPLSYIKWKRLTRVANCWPNHKHIIQFPWCVFFCVCSHSWRKIRKNRANNFALVLEVSMCHRYVICGKTKKRSTFLFITVISHVTFIYVWKNASKIDKKK